MAFSTNYYREHKSYLEGAYNYEKSIKHNKKNVSFLRRNIHRIEKGLLMKPRRDVFALRFILPTVISFAVLEKEKLINVSEYKWAYQVLKEYFKVVKSMHVNYIKAIDIFDRVKAIPTEQREEKKKQQILRYLRKNNY